MQNIFGAKVEGHGMEQHTLKNISSCWNTKLTFYLETSGSQNSNLYLNVTQIVLISYKTIIILNRCLLCAILLHMITREIVLSAAGNA